VTFKPCFYRHADDEGHILCDKIKSGDCQVSPEICLACPMAAINCLHLRAALDHQARPPLVVRWGNGKMQVWDDMASETISLQRAACAEKVVPIHSPHDCAGCLIRRAIVTPDGIAAAGSRSSTIASTLPDAAMKLPRGASRAPRVPAPVAMMDKPAQASTPTHAANLPATPNNEVSNGLVVQKIIQLQEWLVKRSEAERELAAQPITINPRASLHGTRVIGDEKRVGWTD
jgi:hypothetical protein